MKIEIKKLELRFFKGAKNQVIDLGTKTDIKGANASGKTRIFDAFTWLLFGKDSEDRKDFNIKTLNERNEPLHWVDHSVMGIIAVNGVNTKFERIYREKWVKKRGEEDQEFSGHETVFFINDVPYQLKYYNERVESILPELLFKQVTNPLYFNSMAWRDRREMLFRMAGDFKDSDVIATNPELVKFYEYLADKSFEDFKREIAAKKKILKDALFVLPSRIDEVQLSIVPDPDYKGIEDEIIKLSGRIAQIDGLLLSESEKYNQGSKEYQERQKQIFSKKNEIAKLEYADKANAGKVRNEALLKQRTLQNEMSFLNGTKSQLEAEIKSKQKYISSLHTENDKLRGEWGEINGKSLKFDDAEFICPACKRTLEVEDIEAKRGELQAGFNKDKLAQLKRIEERGQANKTQVEGLEKQIAELQNQVTATLEKLTFKNDELKNLVIPEEAAITPNPQIEKLQAEIIVLEKQQTVIEKPDNTALLVERKEITGKIDSLKSQLTIKGENQKRRDRLNELKYQERDFAQQIADLEKIEFQCEAFTRAKVNMIEQKVNSMFSIVKFRMFKEQINGGIDECCDTLVNGVPFSDANTAGQIQAGLDIIKTLSRHYDTYAPVFVDNRESVAEIPDMDCQVINLIHVPGLPLTVEACSDITEKLTMQN